MQKLSEGQLDEAARQGVATVIDNCGGPNALCLSQTARTMEKMVRNLDALIASLGADNE
jgi:hypothetical protein